MSDTLHWIGGTQIPPIDTICTSLKAKFQEQEREIERLQRENKELKSEHYKDAELARLRKITDSLHEQLCFGFGITREEHESIMKWLAGKEGGNLEYRFIPTGIGDIGFVEYNGDKFKFKDLG